MMVVVVVMRVVVRGMMVVEVSDGDGGVMC